MRRLLKKAADACCGNFEWKIKENIWGEYMEGTSESGDKKYFIIPKYEIVSKEGDNEETVGVYHTPEAAVMAAQFDER